MTLKFLSEKLERKYCCHQKRLGRFQVKLYFRPVPGELCSRPVLFQMSDMCVEMSARWVGIQV